MLEPPPHAANKAVATAQERAAQVERIDAEILHNARHSRTLEVARRTAAFDCPAERFRGSKDPVCPWNSAPLRKIGFGSVEAGRIPGTRHLQSATFIYPRAGPPQSVAAITPASLRA